MTSKTLSAGDYIDSHCTRCRMVTNHTIIAMVEDRVVRVQCNTCDGMHNYRAAKQEKPKAAKTVSASASTKDSAKRQSRPSTARADLDEWVALGQTADLSKAIVYNMSQAFRVKDLVDHPAFGMGVVTATFKPNKMEVLFQEGRKLLRCQVR